ncbi:hypothetical protein GGF37_007160, partial [Kickxella alabastrina]
NPAQRIGYGPKGIAELKKHRFFRKIDWERLERDHASFTPPIVPVVASDCDVSNFATEFTTEELATSIVRGSLLDPDMDNVSDEAKQLDSTAGRDRYPAVAITDHIPTTACNIANANKNDAAKAGDDIDPATAFLGFSYVANSVLDTVR